MDHVKNVSFLKGHRNKVLALAGALALSLALVACDDGSSPKGDALPVITSQPASTTVVMKGSTIVLSVTATGAASYQWVKGTADTLVGDTLPILTLTNADTLINGSTYKCVVKNNGGSVSSANAKVFVYASQYFVPMSTLVDTGLAVFEGNCTGCHQSEGHGYAGSTPPLANSDFFMNNRHLTIRIVLGGYESVPITVNGLHYEGNMPTWAGSLTNTEIAGVLTYLRSVKNDSTVVSCDGVPHDELDGFASCQKVARTPAAMAIDSVAVWEVKAVRDSLGLDNP